MGRKIAISKRYIFFYHAINLQVVHIIQFWKNKKYNKTSTNKTQNLLKVIYRF